MLIEWDTAPSDLVTIIGPNGEKLYALPRVNCSDIGRPAFLQFTITMMNCLCYASIQGLTITGKIIWVLSPQANKNAHNNRHGMMNVMLSRSTRPENINFSSVEWTEEVFKN